ncbi:MAG TPA: hypothetical protein VGH02_12215 [Rhizomicrobium sp.]
MAFARSAAMALAAIFANSGTAIAQGNTCNLNDRQIIYQIDECINGNCQTGGEMLKFVGGTVLRYHANDAGTVYRLGQTIRLESDPLNSKAGQFMGPLSAHNTLLTASYEENVVTLIQDEAIKRSGDADGHVVSTQRVRIRPDCTFCDVIEFTLVGTLADGTEVGRRTMSGSKCYVSDVPPE